MSETMKDLATEALRRAIDAATQTGEFLQEQAPLVVQELVRWQIVSSIAAVLISSAILVAYWWGGSKIVRSGEKTVLGDYEYEAPWFIFGAFFSFFCVVGFLINAFTAIKWIVAPRVALIEYAANLVR